MPRIAKSSRYTAQKKEALQNLNKVELNEKLEQKKSELHEVQDLMTVEKNNLNEHRPKEIQHKSARFTEFKQVRDTITDDITEIKNQIKQNTQPVRINNESVNIGLGVSATLNPMSDEHEIRNQSDTRFEDVAQGNIMGFSTKDSGIDSTENSAFLNNQFTFGENKTPVGIEERNTIQRILDRQNHVRNMNAEQREHFNKVRSGEISPMEALMNPKTVQRIQVQNGADKIFMSAEDRKLRDSYQKDEYNEAMRETIIAERIESQRTQQNILNQQLNPLGYVQAENQQNPISETLMGIDMAARGFEHISNGGREMQDYNSESTQTNAADIQQQAFHNNVALAAMPNQRATKQDLNKSQNTAKKKENDSRPLHEKSQAEQQLGYFAQGLQETVTSYQTMGINLGNYIQNKPQIQQSRPPYQDQYVGSFYAALDQTQEEKIPFDKAFGNQMNILGEANKNKPTAQIAGNLALEAALWAIPIPLALGARAVGFLGRGLSMGDSLVGKTVEAAFGTGTKTEKANSKTNPWNQGTYAALNPSREKLPSDIFGLDTVSSFFTTPFKFGSGAGKATGKTVGSQSKTNKSVEEDYYYNNKSELPKDKQLRKIDSEKLFADDVVNQQYNAFIGESKSLGKTFQGIRINLGIGLGYAKSNKGKFKGSGSGGNTPSKPTTPKPDEPKITKTNNGLELILEQKPVTKTKTTTKQVIEQAKKKKQKKQSQGSEYYLSTDFIRSSPIAAQESKLTFGLPSLKLDFGQSLKQEFALGQLGQKPIQQTKQISKQQSKQQIKQPSAAILNPFMAKGNARPTAAVIPMLATPYPYAQQATQSHMRPVMPIPWGLQEGRRKGRKNKKRKSKGKQGWYVPFVDPLNLTSQFKTTGDGTTNKLFKYWGTGNLQTKVGYF